MSRLKQIRVRGFRSLRDIELTDLEPVTVLIGPNGSGKSNLLSALRMVTHMRSQSLRLFVGRAGGASDLLHYGPRETPEVSLRLGFETDAEACYAYDARLDYAAGDAFIFTEERVGSQNGGGQEWHWAAAGAGHGESKLEEQWEEPGVSIVQELLGRLHFFHFHDTSYTSALRTNARRVDDQHLHSNGSNLPAYLLRLRESKEPSNRAAFRRIEGLVRQIAPFIRELRPEALEGDAVRLAWVDDRGQVFGPHHLSDGTLRAIALFTALGQPADQLPLFCTIDEPELGLHPAALQLFFELVRSASQHCQVLLATQSSALLDYFEADEVVVAERVDNGTRFRRLQAEALASWLTDYRLSELYDSNVLGGRP